MAKKRKNKSKAYQDMFKLKDNYVFYQRLNNDSAAQAHIWKKVYTSAMNDFSDGLKFYNVIDTETIGNTLVSQGYSEQARELSFLNQIFGIPNNGEIHISQYNKYIEQTNDILETSDEYKRISVLLKQNKTKRKISKEDMAQVMTLFDTTFHNNFRANLNDFLRRVGISNLIASNNKTAWLDEMDYVIRKSIDQSIKSLNIEKEKTKNENIRIWLDVFNLIKKSENQLQKLQSDLFKRYNLDYVLDNLYEWNRNRISDNNKSLSGLANELKKSYNIDITEFNGVDRIINEITKSLSGTYDLSTSSSKRVQNKNINLDSITLFSSSLRMDLDGLLNFFSTQLNSEDSLQDIENYIESFGSFISTWRDIFVVYEAVNLDNTNENLSGIYSLSMLPSFLDRIGTKVNGDEIVSLLYNTIPGAIGSESFGEIEDKISLAMSESMASFLFNDWSSIGNPTRNSIYLFNLDGIRIPLSYLLIAAGMTILDIQKNPSSYFKINFNLPSNILYPETINPFDKDIGMQGYWNEQRDAVISGSTFSIRFLEGFKGRIKDLLGKM